MQKAKLTPLVELEVVEGVDNSLEAAVSDSRLVSI